MTSMIRHQAFHLIFCAAKIVSCQEAIRCFFQRNWWRNCLILGVKNLYVQLRFRPLKLLATKQEQNKELATITYDVWENDHLLFRRITRKKRTHALNELQFLSRAWHSLILTSLQAMETMTLLLQIITKHRIANDLQHTGTQGHCPARFSSNF